jgi:hypothetical protein|tara:strand:+ start:262 stop:627 length:366 start_codon:yes stop_codon:yes gene_type:complete
MRKLDNRLFFMCCALILTTLLGCGKSALPPPVSITFRHSLIDIGEVVIITNNSNHHLYNVRVVGRNFDEISSASVQASEHLSPGDSIEVGWLEFEAWVPRPGETIEVYCDNYLTPKTAFVP